MEDMVRRNSGSRAFLDPRIYRKRYGDRHEMARDQKAVSESAEGNSSLLLPEAERPCHDCGLPEG